MPAPRALTLAGQTLMGLANQLYSRRLLCSSGLSYRIITVPCGPSPQFAYRAGRTGVEVPTKVGGYLLLFILTPSEGCL